MMRVTSDNTFVKVWTDGCSPIVFMKLKNDFLGLVNTFELYAESSIKPIKSMISSHRDVYLLLDLSDTNYDDVESLLQYFRHNLAKHMKATFRYISIVRSHNSPGLLLKSRPETPVGVFGTFFDALSTINDIRTKVCA